MPHAVIQNYQKSYPSDQLSDWESQCCSKSCILQIELPSSVEGVHDPKKNAMVNTLMYKLENTKFTRQSKTYHSCCPVCIEKMSNSVNHTIWVNLPKRLIQTFHTRFSTSSTLQHLSNFSLLEFVTTKRVSCVATSARRLCRSMCRTSENDLTAPHWTQ
jgi:hypothetical protein